MKKFLLISLPLILSSCGMAEEKMIASYEIRWLNYDGSLLVYQEVQEGSYPTYKGPTPYKGENYKFSGWSPALVSVSGDASYVAQFTEVIPEKTVVQLTADNWSDYLNMNIEYQAGYTSYFADLGENWIYSYYIRFIFSSRKNEYVFNNASLYFKWVDDCGFGSPYASNPKTETSSAYAKLDISGSGQTELLEINTKHSQEQFISYMSHVGANKYSSIDLIEVRGTVTF